MKTFQLALFCCFILGIQNKMMAQTDLLYNFITETNQSFSNGVVSDGTYIYGTKLDGGAYGKGYIYRVKMDNSDFSILVSFDGENSGMGACGTLVLDQDTLYGATDMGGAHDFGTIFKVKTDGTGFEKIFDLDESNGSVSNSLILSEGYLYVAGNALFKIKTDGSDFKSLYYFNSTNGMASSSPLTRQGDFLFGTTYRGGVNDNGLLFRIKTDGTGYTLLKNDFSNGDIGCIPYGKLAVIDSSVYGTTMQGGDSYAGYIYKIKTNGSYFEVIKYLGVGEGINPDGLISVDSILYGTTVNGGNGNGVVFKVDTTGSNYQAIHLFTRGDGANPTGMLSTFNKTLYGYANGGPYNYGVVFSLKPDGSEFTCIKNIEATNMGYLPRGAMAVTSSKCYGLTKGGGKYNSGVLYTLNPDGSNYQVIHDFTGEDGSNPIGSLVLLNDTLYGMTNMGGYEGQGAAFVYTLNNGEFTKIHDFSYGGNFPTGSACILGSEIYGMTQGGGINNKGTLFKMKKDGSAYTKVLDFEGTGLVRPSGTLACYDSIFYGLALSDTSSNSGVVAVFSVHPDGTGLKVLHVSDGIDAGKYGESIITDGTYLYALAKQGGSDDFGVLFKMKTDGTEFSKLLDFSWDIGAFPQDPLVLCDTLLLVSTASAGPGGFGGVIGIKTNGESFYNLVDYSKLYAKKSTYVLKTQKENVSPVSKSASYGNTEGAISVNGNMLFMAVDQQLGDITRGSIQKCEIVAPKLTQLITFNSLDEKVYGDASFELSATSSSGLVINYASSNPAVATVNSNVVTITGVGVTTITASQPGNTEYLAAEDVTHELKVNPKTLTITGNFTVSDKTFDNTSAAVIAEDNLTLSGIVEGDEVDMTYTAEFSQSEIGVNIPVSLSGILLTGADKDNYTLSLNNVSTTTATISALVGIEETSENSIMAYPNPCTDHIYFNNTNQITKVTFSDLVGLKVLEISGSEAQEINVSQLKHGVYIMKVEMTSGSIKTFKITKNN